MIVATLADVAVSYGARTILDGVSWQIQSGAKIGLVGANGAGKSTLLRLIVGEIVPDRGTIVRAREARIGYLAQEPVLDSNRTVWEEVLSAATALARVQASTLLIVGGYDVPLGPITVVGPVVMAVTCLILIARTRGRFTRALAGIILVGSAAALYIIDPVVMGQWLGGALDRL